MGQQISAAVENANSAAAGSSFHIPSTDGKSRSENGDTNRQAWRNNLSGVIVPQSSSTSSSSRDSNAGPGETAKSGRKSDSEMNRVSIRTAIDTFIENCLSASNDLSPSSEERALDGSRPDSATNPATEDDSKFSGDSLLTRKSDSVIDVSDSPRNFGVNFNKASNHIAGENGGTVEEYSDDKELIIFDDDQVSVENEGRGDSREPKVESPKGEDKHSPGSKEKGESGELKDSKPENSESPWKESLPGTSDTAVSEKSTKDPPVGEKQSSFSAFLQDQLKKVDFDKQEELAQLASNKDIQSHGQMLMWEMSKKPMSMSDTASSSAGGDASSFPLGPVRLQTLIDKVLDNSLNNKDLRPETSYMRRKREAAALTQDHDKSPLEPSPPTRSPLDAIRDAKFKEDCGTSSQENEKRSKPVKITLCFKDHIEKMLIESFMSYEEEERKEAMKNATGGNYETTKPLVETDCERMNARKDSGKPVSDGTISVQDIVDRVISQTEVISKLLTPSASSSSSESSKTSSAGSGDAVSSGSSAPLHPSMKYQNISHHSKALLEAQKQTVQKEHQSSTTLGRKRGRPRLGSPSSNSWTGEPGKDTKSGYPDSRGRDLSGCQVPYGLHPDSSRSSSSSIHGHARTGQGPPPLDYVPHGSVQYGISVGIPLVTSQGTAPSSSAMFHQRHLTQKRQHQQQPESKVPGYTPQTPGHDAFQLRGDQHISGQVPQHPTRGQQHHSQQHPGHPPSGKPPPPLILVDQVKDNSSCAGSRLVPVSHIPTKSCSCHNCVAHFSRERSPSHISNPAQQSRSSTSEQDRHNDTAAHPSHYHSYPTPSTRRASKDFYPPAITVGNEAVMQAQALPPQPVMGGYEVNQRQRVEPAHAPPSRDSGRYYEPRVRNPSPGHYTPYQAPAGVAKGMAMDPRFLEPDRHAPRHPALPDRAVYDSDPGRRPARDKVHILENPPVAVLPFVPAICQDTEQPLDLSVKPSPAHSKDTRKGFELAPDIPRQEAAFHDSRPAYRRSSGEVSARGQGEHDHYVEYKQRGPSGHHLQRLENSVDRYLPQGQPAPLHQATPLHQSHPHHLHPPQPQTFQQQLPPTKAGHLHPPPHPPGRPDGRGGAGHTQPEPRHHQQPTQRQESPSHRGPPSLHLSPSPVGHPYIVPNSSPSHPVPPPHQSVVTPAQTVSSAVPSPGCIQQHQNSRSPGLSSGVQPPRSTPDSSPVPQPYLNSCGQPRPITSTSPANYQRPASHGPEQDPRTTPVPALPPASTPPHPQNASSPDDQSGSRLNVSRHEPIQNIIGNHPPSDILYLICRLCRQTYGSPYGFRKHFRNQHGFEPKAEHTIVQTISATKTAMAHTGPLDADEKVVEVNFPKEEKVFCGDGLPAGKIDTGASSASTSNSGALDDSKLDFKKEISENTKFLECPECGQTFQLNDFGSYKRHCRQHSLQRNSGPFACHDCQKSFAEPGQLQEHLLTHNTFTPSVCGICRTFFSSPNYLAVHLQAAHGHVYSSDGGDKAVIPAEGTDNSKLMVDNTVPKSESVPADHDTDCEVIVLRKSGSFSGISHAAPVPPRGQPVAQPTAAFQGSSSKMSPNSSSSSLCPKNHKLPLSKRHRINLASTDSQLFTVHTPKGLEVQKLPADAVVTTASPDSSYDEAKFRLDCQAGSSGSQKAVSTAGSDTSRDSNSEMLVAGKEKRSENFVANLPKQIEDVPMRSASGCGKDDAESNSSDRCGSVESNTLSVEGSRAPTPVIEEVDMFYKHKKYSRHRKRVSSSDLGSELEPKTLKFDSTSQLDQSSYSVSSTANSGIIFRDCESSCLHSDDSKDSNPSSTKSKAEEGKVDEKSGNKRGRKDDCGEKTSEYRGRKAETVPDDSKSGDGAKKTNSGEEVGLKFKWDRQTRSQAGKTVQSVSYTS